MKRRNSFYDRQLTSNLKTEENSDKKKNRWDIFDRIDLFGSEPPHFNLERKDSIGTPFGFICSVLLITIILAFGCAKTIQLVNSDNPAISYFSEEGFYTQESDQLDPKNFKFAVSVINVRTKKVLDDKRLVSFKALIVEGDGSNPYKSVQEIDTHQCTKEDLKQFYKTTRRQASSIQSLINKNGFYCLNDRDIHNNTVNYKLFGDSHTVNHRRIEFSFLPCQSGPYTDYERGRDESHCETGPN